MASAIIAALLILAYSSSKKSGTFEFNTFSLKSGRRKAGKLR